jgi:hypothetical protein
MMVHASLHMEYVSMRGWAIGHRSTSDLPLYTSPAGHCPQLDPPCLPYQIRGKGDHQVGFLASPGETLRHLPYQSQEIQDSREKTSKQKQKPLWSNHANLPLSSALHRLQGWFSCGVFSPTILQSTSLSPSFPKRANTNNLAGPIRFQLLSHRR